MSSPSKKNLSFTMYPGNEFSENVLMSGNVKIGTDNYFSSGVQIYGPIVIGNGNFFGPNTVVGCPAQDQRLSISEHKRRLNGSGDLKTKVVIGNNNIIREFITIHGGLTSETQIGNNCYLMSYCHVSHDTRIGNQVIMSNSVQLGGYTSVLDNANLGLSSCVHQFIVIGAFTMIGMGSVVTKNIVPGLKVYGTPAIPAGLNKVGLSRAGLRSFDWEDDYLADPLNSTANTFLSEQNRRFKKEVEIRTGEYESVKNYSGVIK